MPALESDLRRQLENVIIQARDVAEGAARSALQKRAVDVAEPFSHFGPKEKELRNRLRARGRQVGDFRNPNKTQSIDQLTQELAYEFWHRMLFARFLAENHLLMHPNGVAVSLEECEALAKDADPPASNGFVLAARFASTMLPQIFRTDDVLLEIDFAPEQRLALEKLLTSLPQTTFIADDSLGWVYQFWQSKKKEEVNQSGDKIDGRTLSAVTQLFTEHYMVQFLLHNTIGAWWCGRHGIQGPPGGAGVPDGKSPVEMEYLRWRDDGTPAAGKFEGWPKTLADFKMLDPCCGSGHFLVAAFNLLVPLRIHDEKLTTRQACDAVLRDNLFGLELDPRCTQIAAFALALAAWKFPGEDGQLLGYRPLPQLHIACSGLGVAGKKDDWLALANDDKRLRDGMDRLYDLFQQAPDLGSLIEPRREKGDLYEAGFAELQPLLAKALAKMTEDVDLSAVGVAAQGITKAAEILSSRYEIVVTNVPYLGRVKQNAAMRDYIEQHYSHGKADLATAFVLRCLELCKSAGSTALVTPQNWLFLKSYKSLRQTLLARRTWNIIARLGPNAFQDMNFWAATTALSIISMPHPTGSSVLFGIDVSEVKSQSAKAAKLAGRETATSQFVVQGDQLKNPDARIELTLHSQPQFLSDFADAYRGQGSGDTNRFICCFWEVDCGKSARWIYLATSPETTSHFGGCTQALLWEDGKGQLAKFQDDLVASGMPKDGWQRGWPAWGVPGIRLTPMSDFPASLHDGNHFDSNCAVIVPKDVCNLPAIWCFCSTSAYKDAVRATDQSPKVTSANLVKIPFDLAHWQAVAAEKYSNELPKPHSNDPTQWLFQGDIATSTDPLQVAIARLLGYRWPDQPKIPNAVDSLVDDDGIVSLPGVRGNSPAAERLVEVLHIAYGANWSDSVLHTLLTEAGSKAGTTFDDFLRNQFFEQHCKRFQHRPFLWQVWDGRKDGFSVLLNYHKLNHKTLENLTYSYLGDWITAQSRSDKVGADLRLGAAQELQAKLKLILSGEPPYDIFVRWKPLHEQPIGWHPDLNDGVRINIRPFMEADILRKKPNIRRPKDRGEEPQRDKADYPWFWNGNDFVGDRVNDIHLTNSEKQAARSRKDGAK